MARKKATKEEPVVTIERRLIKYWNDDIAKEWYKLEAYIFEDGEMADGMPVMIANGDADWARRESRHYGLSIREEE